MEAIMEFISDKLLDDLWAGLVEQELIKTAAPVAFLLAFVSELTPDEQATLASKPRRK